MTPSIWIRSIKNLTDARYFAAVGIEGMSMEAGMDNLHIWYAIREWVEGVKWGLEPLQWDEEFVARMYIDIKPDVLFVPEARLPVLPSPLPLVVEQSDLCDGPYRYLRLYETGMLLASLPDQDLLQADWTPDLLHSVLDAGYTGGICFVGEPEEQTGIRDYTQMEKMLDVLGV